VPIPNPKNHCASNSLRLCAETKPKERGKKSPLDSSDTSIEGQRKNPTEQEPPSCHQAGESAFASAIPDSEKPMEIDSEDHKKCARIPNNVSIRENPPNPGSPDTGTPEQNN